MGGQIDLWADYTGESKAHQNDKPIWAVGDDEDVKHEWLNNEFSHLLSQNRERFQGIQRNYALYRGVQYLSQENRNDTRDVSQDRSRISQKVVFNDYYDLTQNKTARLIKYRPAVAVLPTNDEFEDKIAADATSKTLSNLWYTTKFEGEMQPDFVKLVKISGEAYFFIEWNKYLGPLHPEYKKNEKEYGPELKKLGKTPLRDSSGAIERDEEGKPIYIYEQLHVGDAEYKIKMPTEVLVEEANKWRDVKYIIELEVMDLYSARLKYPKSTTDIEEEEFQVYDYTSFSTRKSNAEVMIKTFYHKKCKEVPEGMKIVFTDKGILESGPLPYEHGELPCIRMTDIDRPGELHASSFYDVIKGLVGARNNIQNMALKQIIFGAHPKWMFPQNSVKKESLGNDFTLVEYKGPQAPVLVQSNPVSAQMLDFAGSLKEEIREKAGVSGVSQGEPPAGVTAAVALQFLSELENERMNEDVLKYNEFIRQVAVMSIAVMSQYYRADDGRTLQILGKGNQWQVEFIDGKALSKSFDIRIQNSSALPQSKSARLQYILDLRKEFPNIITDEQTMDLLEFAQNEKFVDLATVSTKASEAENEQLLQMKEVPEPQQYEDHIVHWNTHGKAIRQWSFKNQTPKEVQQRMIDHQMVHEMFMSLSAAANPAYMEKLAELKGFPMFFSVPGPTSRIVPPLPPAPPEMMQQGLEGYGDPGAPVAPDAGPIGQPMPPIESQVPMEQIPTKLR